MKVHTQSYCTCITGYCIPNSGCVHTLMCVLHQALYTFAENSLAPSPILPSSLFLPPSHPPLFFELTPHEGGTRIHPSFQRFHLSGNLTLCTYVLVLGAFTCFRRKFPPSPPLPPLSCPASTFNLDSWWRTHSFDDFEMYLDTRYRE